MSVDVLCNSLSQELAYLVMRGPQKEELMLFLEELKKIDDSCVNKVALSVLCGVTENIIQKIHAEEWVCDIIEDDLDLDEYAASLQD